MLTILLKQKLPILYLKEDNIFCPQDLGFGFSLQNIKHDFGVYVCQEYVNYQAKRL